MTDDNALTIDYDRNSRRSVTLTARHGSKVLAMDSLDIRKISARETFADRVCEGRPGINRDHILAELLQIADGPTEKQPPPAADAQPIELSDEDRRDGLAMLRHPGLVALSSMTWRGLVLRVKRHSRQPCF